LRVIFAGTPEFALPTLQRLIDHDVDLKAVMTQPDRPKGRGRKLTASPVKQLAVAHSIDVLQPERITDDWVAQVRELHPDVVLVVAYGLILPTAFLEVPGFGCINVHASLLPRWRGAAPVARAVEAGDSHTGVTIMQMNAGLDQGPILSRAVCPIEVHDTTQTLQEKLAELGATQLLNVLERVPDILHDAVPQDDSQAVYAAKLSVVEARIDWCRPAIEIVNQINAFNPWPIARTRYQNINLRLWKAEQSCISTPGVGVGEVVESNARGIVVGAGHNAVRIVCLQREGKRAMRAADFLSGCPVAVGSVFE